MLKKSGFELKIQHLVKQCDKFKKLNYYSKYRAFLSFISVATLVFSLKLRITYGLAVTLYLLLAKSIIEYSTFSRQEILFSSSVASPPIP